MNQAVLDQIMEKWDSRPKDRRAQADAMVFIAACERAVAIFTNDSLPHKAAVPGATQQASSEAGFEPAADPMTPKRPAKAASFGGNSGIAGDISIL
jgi:hypothetical protein